MRQLVDLAITAALMYLSVVFITGEWLWLAAILAAEPSTRFTFLVSYVLLYIIVKISRS